MEEEEEESIYLFVPFYDIITMIKLVIRNFIKFSRILKNFEEEVERTRLSRIAEIDVTISPSNEKFKSSKKF